MKQIKLLVVLDAEYDPGVLTLEPHDINGLPSAVAHWLDNYFNDQEDGDYYLRNPVVYKSLVDLQTDITEGRLKGLT